MKDGIEYLCNYIKDNNIKNILEIGSAIGYSSIKMALVDDDIKINSELDSLLLTKDFFKKIIIFNSCSDVDNWENWFVVYGSYWFI